MDKVWACTFLHEELGAFGKHLGEDRLLDDASRGFGGSSSAGDSDTVVPPETSLGNLE